MGTRVHTTETKSRNRSPLARATFVRNFATMPGPTLDFSFLNAAARGGDVGKHVEETYVRDDECEIFFVEPFSQPRMFECARNVD